MLVCAADMLVYSRWLPFLVFSTLDRISFSAARTALTSSETDPALIDITYDL